MMAELNITYDPKNPEEFNDIKLMLRTHDIYYGLEELKEQIRSKLKYGHNFKNPDEVLEWIRDEIYSIMQDDFN